MTVVPTGGWAMPGPDGRSGGPGLASTDGMLAQVESAPLRRIERVWPIFHTAVSVLFVVGLWQSGYPVWRTAVAAVLLLGNAVRNFAWRQTTLPVAVMEEASGHRCPMSGR